MNQRREKKSFNFEMYNFVPFPIIIFGPLGELSYYNQEAEDVLAISGLSEAEIVNLRTTIYNRFAATKDNRFHHIVYNDRELVCTITTITFKKDIAYKLVLFRTEGMLDSVEQDLHVLTREMSILNKIIDSSYDGIYITDGEGRTLYFNDSFMRISGFKKEETIGRRLQDLVAENYIPNSCGVEVLKHKKPVSTIINYYNGVEAMVSGTPVFDEDGKIIRVISNVRDITELSRLREELKEAHVLTDSYKKQLWEFQKDYLIKEKVVANSKPMLDIIDLIMKAAFADSPILITGESGVGKDEIAKLIHHSSERSKDGAFIRVNCSAIPEALLESEMFGYEPHAFTGANKKGKAGLFELADGGTLFLNEIGDMPLSLQVKLLDAVQERAVYRVGGTKPFKFNARIITATNRSLEDLIKEKKFRLDLYYRLNVISVHIPPLRDRQEDIVPLISLFLEQTKEKYGIEKTISPQALNKMLEYPWPGNIRELRNIIERLLVTSPNNTIDVKDLPEHIRASLGQGDNRQEDEFFSLIGSGENMKGVLETIERRMIGRALERAGNMREAARLLGIDLSTLVRKKRRYFTDR